LKGRALPAERHRPPAASEVSAGGVVVRDHETIVIVPRRRAADGRRVLALPKGHVDEGETPLQAAMREVREEAGVDVALIAELGEVRYWYTRRRRRIPKTVAFYLFAYLTGDLADHDEEVEEARWVPLEEAHTSLSYPGEREMVGRAIALLAEAGRPPAPTRRGRTSDAGKDR
jgi:mutator protein MutT